MRFAILLAFAALSCHSAVLRDGNRITVSDAEGGVVIEFATPVSFEYERWWGATPPLRGVPLSMESQAITLDERQDGGVRLATRFLEVTLANGAVAIKTTSGREVTSMPRSAGRRGFELKAHDNEQFYGLGATDAPNLNLRGRKISSTRSLLVSSQGYGLYIPSGAAAFDLGDTIIVTTRDARFQIYYGPNPKEILEQHAIVTHTQTDLAETTLGTRDERKLPKEIRRVAINESNYCDSPRILNQLSLSGELFPALDLAKLGRNDQLVRLLPFLYDSKLAPHPDVEQRRSPWDVYLVAYLREAHDRGLPFVRPLLMQFPQDKGLDAHSDVYMLGDEILLAPGCNVTSIDLPRGSWTDLRNNVRHAGRRKIANDPGAGLPIFAKAGSLIPLNSTRRGRSLELHYFPSSGAEFFVYETEVNDYSQFHAAPAGDFMRVESESKVERTCEWILHHTPAKPKSVGETGHAFKEAANRAALLPGTWFHDPATGNLHIVVATVAGEDHIINMSF